MESTPAAPPRRPGRPPKVQTVREVTVEPHRLPSSLNITGSSDTSFIEIDESISPTLEEPSSSAVPAGGSECRRSSRKKIIKFDVRDLLNKSRKPHKIQIEARIDSNAPPAVFNAHTQKVVLAGNMHLPETASSSSGTLVDSGNAVTDLTSNQKNFKEKSAFFRRFSVSEQRGGPTPLRPTVPGVTMLDHEPEALQATQIAQARRLSRTQEIFNATMMKSKQNSSLIVAQMDASSFAAPPAPRTAGASKARRNVSAKSQAATGVTPGGEFIVQRRRGRPPKVRPAVEVTVAEVSSSLSPSKRPVGTAPTVSQQAQNWRDYKASLEHPTSSPRSKQKTAAERKFPQNTQCESFGTSTLSAEVILEISSSSSATSAEAAAVLMSVSNEKHQRSFAAVSYNDANASASAQGIMCNGMDEITEVPSVEVELAINTCTTTEQPANDDIAYVVDDDEIFIIESDQSQPQHSASHEVSDTESTSTEPASTGGFSTTSKHYREGDELRVKLKRLSMPSMSPEQGRRTPSVSSASSVDGGLTSPIKERKRPSNKKYIGQGAPRIPQSLPVETAPAQTEEGQEKPQEWVEATQEEVNAMEQPSLTVQHDEVIEVEFVDVLPVSEEESDVVIEIPDVEYTASMHTMQTLEPTQREEPPQPSVNRHISSQEEAISYPNNEVAEIVNIVELESSAEPAASSLRAQHHKTEDLRIVQPAPPEEPPPPVIQHKERITLPPKKQSRKFQHFQETFEAPAVVQASLIVDKPSTSLLAPASRSMDPMTAQDAVASVDSVRLPSETENSIIRNVNVETSTLLDILRAVQSNEVINRTAPVPLAENPCSPAPVQVVADPMPKLTVEEPPEAYIVVEAAEAQREALVEETVSTETSTFPAAVGTEPRITTTEPLPERLEANPPIESTPTAAFAGEHAAEQPSVVPLVCTTPPPQPPHKKRVSKIQAELQQLSRDATALAQQAESEALQMSSQHNEVVEPEKRQDKDGANRAKMRLASDSPSGESHREKPHKPHLEDATGTPTVSPSVTPTCTPKRVKHKAKSAVLEPSGATQLSESTSGAKKKPKKTDGEEQPRSCSPAALDNPSIEKDKEKELTPSRKSEKKKFLEMENAVAFEQSRNLDDKSAKKKRQRKLKEAFEAALLSGIADAATMAIAEEAQEVAGTLAVVEAAEDPKTQCAPHEAMDGLAPQPAEEKVQKATKGNKSALSFEPPDPLKDIEKFIEAGVNLLKRGYNDERLEEENAENNGQSETQPAKPLTPGPELDPPSVEIVSSIETITGTENAASVEPQPTVEAETAEGDAKTSPPPLDFGLYETPVDTPIATPTASPPPKSPTLVEDVMCAGDETALRRSHRIKQITKTPKALVGRGLVRDKERISLKDHVETKTHYSLDDHLMDLAEVEAKNARFLKDMEERLSNFHVIQGNDYKCERIISKEARRMLCDCFLTVEEEERGELGCGDDCLNRLLMIECGPDCNVKDRCTNKRFQKFLCSPCRVFRTEKKGFGIMADIEILPGEFIMEYVGEVIDDDEFERRRTLYSQEKNRHYYFMALRSDAIIDATTKGNISRFINHSCDPNAETQKWTVNGELRIGFFSRKSILPGEEITFDYQYQRYGREAQRCYCESANCRGWIGEEPNSDEGEQLEDDSDEEEESLLGDDEDDDDDEDSDDSVTDPAEVRKKLEIAAAEARLTPTMGGDELVKAKGRRGKDDGDEEEEEDSKSKFKRLLSKMAEKMAKRQQQRQTPGKPKGEQQKRKRRRGGKQVRSDTSRYLEDPDIEDEVNFLSRCGVKNQLDTLRLSRLMVRAKLAQTRLNLLQILREGELPCRRLFLDYHGLRLLHGWMSEDGGDMDMRLALLSTLTSLPLVNKTVLTESKVYQTVRNWCAAATPSAATNGSPSDESSKESSSSGSQQPQPQVTAPTPSAEVDVPTELQRLAAAKLLANWDSLPDIFRIPKRERIEQMKEHEREADLQYEAEAEASDAVDADAKTESGGRIDRYQRDRFGTASSRYSKPYGKETARAITAICSNVPGDPRRRAPLLDASGIVAASAQDSATKHLSKEQRRELFAAKVARDEAEKRLAEKRRDFETKCRFFGLDPKKTPPNELPFCVVPTTGQWYSVERQPIPTPPTYAHIQVPPKPKSTDPADYDLPAAVATLPANWQYALTPQGHIYYYHTQKRVPQWEPPTEETSEADTASEATESEGETENKSPVRSSAEEEEEDDNDEVLMGLDEDTLKAYIDKKVEQRHQKRYSHLVGERGISPRREEDRIYNQMEVRKYKENKEKIRKRKEEIRRRRAEAQRAVVQGAATTTTGEEAVSDTGTESEAESTADTADTAESAPTAEAVAEDRDDKKVDDNGEVAGALPIQDYLLSSSDEEHSLELNAGLKEECNNSPLLEKIVQGDKIVDELDALNATRKLKRPLPPHRDLATMATGSSSAASTSHTLSSAASALEKYEYKKRKLEKKEKARKGKEADQKYRKLKEKFRCDIAGIIVSNLKPYCKENCPIGRIQSDADYNHLARKLTHFVMIKELKYCESVGQTLVVTESVKNKSREFIKKYMAKYGSVYEKPANDPEFKDIPFTL